MPVDCIGAGITGDRMDEFRKRILEWGRRNLVPYPWRGTQDPYRVLVAEVLLHRTRSEQVVPVYEKFISRYPDVDSLCRAEYSDLEALLLPLGLRWRIKKLKEMARTLAERFGSRIPEDYGELVTLPGVSDYIASAVRCFAFGHPEPLLDTNTVRVAGRFFGIRVTDSTRRSRKFREFMKKLVPAENPRLFNYALLDYGKLVCTSRNPGCESCVLRHMCCQYQTEGKKIK